MIPLRWLALVRDYRRHPWLPLLSVLGVALGVAVVVALDLAIESARGSLRDSTVAVAGRATHQVTGVSGALDERVYARLRVEAGLRQSTPVVEGFVRTGRIPGRPLRLLGVDPIAEATFRSFLAGAGDGGGDGGGAGPGMLVPGEPTVVLPASLAVASGIRVGDTIEVTGPTGSGRVVVTGTFAPAERLAREGTHDLVLADLSVAQALLDRVGRLDRIDLILPEGAEGDRAVEAARALLPPDARIRTAGARTRELLGMTRAFELNLTALSLLALVFGIFLIYNAVTFSVVRRRERIGMLRALGVTRGEILRGLLAEAGLVGVAGSALGLVLGVAMGRGLVRLVTRTVNDLYTFVQVDGLSVDPGVLAKGVALGLVATQVAAIGPALEAARGPVTGTLRRSALEARTRGRVFTAGVAGVALGLLGAAVFRVGPSGAAAGFLGLALVMGAIALVTPLAAVGCTRLLSPVAGRVAGVTGRMAARGVVRSLSRTGPALAALVVAVSVTVGLGAMISSFRHTVERWLDHTLQADVYVSAAGLGVARIPDPLRPELVERVRSLPGVEAASTYRGLDFEGPWGPMRLVALDLAPPGEAAFRFTSGAAADIFREFRSVDAVLVSEPFTTRTGIGPGSEISLPTPVGERTFRVAATYFDYGSDRGVIMMDRKAYDRYWEDDRVTSVGLFAAAGEDSEVLAERVRALDEAEGASVRSNRALREVSLAVFDRTFTVTGVLRLLAFVVAFIGILGALMAIELERSQEFGLLRATGLTPRELWRLVLGETGLMGLMAGLLAVPAGALLAAVMVFVINKRSFGWTLDLRLEPEIVVQSLLLAMAGALLAGIYPAHRIANAEAASVLRDE